MPGLLDLKIPPGELRWRRRVHQKVYKLSSTQKQELMATGIDVFFSVPFLRRAIGKGEVEWSEGQLRKASANVLNAIKATWPKVCTVKDLSRRCSISCTELAAAHGFGASALALLLDVMTAFGLPAKYGPGIAVVEETELSRAARALADSLALPS